MGVKAPPLVSRPSIEEMQGLGWQCLLDRPDSLFVAGAVFHEAGLVKIAWTLEVEPLGPSRCRLSSETREVKPGDTATG
jgi:hypothetical protein